MYQIFMTNKDSKVKFLNEASLKHNFRIDGSSFNKPFLFSFFILLKILSGKKPDAITIRYLHDQSNILKTIILYCNTRLTILLSKISKIKLFWILHNVDKETHEHYPILVKRIRYILGNQAKTIFVTDPLLITVAKKKYPAWASKFDYITFGHRKNECISASDNELLILLRGFEQYRKEGGVVLFCPTAGGEKFSHIKHAAELMFKSKQLGLKYKLVMVGRLTNYLKNNPNIYKAIMDEEDIYLFDRYINYDSQEISLYIDAYWRSLSDQSVSYTLYEAASVAKPLLTMDEGFMGKAVEYYNMGAVLDADMGNLLLANQLINRWNPIHAQQFLVSHSWELAVKRILKHLSD